MAGHKINIGYISTKKDTLSFHVASFISRAFLCSSLLWTSYWCGTSLLCVSLLFADIADIASTTTVVLLTTMIGNVGYNGVAFPCLLTLRHRQPTLSSGRHDHFWLGRRSSNEVGHVETRVPR